MSIGGRGKVGAPRVADGRLAGRAKAGTTAQVGLGERLRGWFGLASGPELGGPAHGRRRAATVGLISYLVMLTGGALVYNLPILNKQGAVRRQVESGAIKVTSLPRVTADLDAEHLRGTELEARRAQRYRELPTAVELPIMMERLESLSLLSGGSATGIEYSEPRWTNGVGRLQTQASFRGSLRETVAYIAAMRALLPAGSLERLSMRLDGAPGRVSAQLSVSVAALEGRPSGAPGWGIEAAWQRAEAVVPEMTLTGFPFTPGAGLWQQSRAAGIDLPELRLAGIARLGEEVRAVIVYDGEGVLVRVGSRIGPFEVLSIDPDGVVVNVDGRSLRLTVAGTTQEMTASGK